MAISSSTRFGLLQVGVQQLRNWRRARLRWMGVALIFFLIFIITPTSSAHAFLQRNKTSGGGEEKNHFISSEEVKTGESLNTHVSNDNSTILREMWVEQDSINFPITKHCGTDKSLKKIRCVDITSDRQLPSHEDYFNEVNYVEFVNSSVSLSHLRALFPNVVHLVVTQTPRAFHLKKITTPQKAKGRTTIPDSGWKSVRFLNMSWNKLEWEGLHFLALFPNLELLDVSNNLISKVDLNLAQLPQLRFIDISGNPLDCTSKLEWLELEKIQLLQADETLCALPPHQNKAKPIWKVTRLIKKIREECRVNCSCEIAYIWEQNHVIHSKNTVNCSHLGFTDFPDPDLLPQPTDTLDLSNNQIKSIRSFVEDVRYERLEVMNLHLDSNRLESIAVLEGSDWFYTFQVFTFRNNSISELPVYVFENVFNHNKNILQIDLSLNPYNCECVTISTLKIWLLKHTSNVKHIDDVRCIETGEQIRYMHREEWCTVEYADGEQLVDILDILSIILALAILFVIVKVYYDYYQYKHGKLPWLVRKM